MPSPLQSHGGAGRLMRLSHCSHAGNATPTPRPRCCASCSSSRARLLPRDRVCEFGWGEGTSVPFRCGFFRGRGRWREDWLGEFRKARDDNYAGNFRGLYGIPVCFFCRPSQRECGKSEFSISIRFAPDSIRSKRWRRAQRSGRSSVESLELKARWVEIWNL